MSNKIRVGVIFGGRSAEHQVSLQSAKSVIAAIDEDKYEVVPIGIDPRGRWLIGHRSNYLTHEDDPKRIALNENGTHVALVAEPRGEQLHPLGQDGVAHTVDVVIPLVHGPYGEDGTLQGLLKLAGIPFVGAGVLGSAVGMDKDIMKRLLRERGLPIAAFETLYAGQPYDAEAVLNKTGLPCFVKPANMGSSVGISKVKARDDLPSALDTAFVYDEKVLVEEFIEGREIECSILGNRDPIASVPGEIIPNHEFYSYEAKYIDEEGATLKIPADLPDAIVSRVQDIALRTFQALHCEGMARVDLFLRGDDEIIVNEINTIPGFTRISMYPKLWEASGIPYPELIDRLIQLALERHEREEKLRTSYNGL